MKTAKAVAVVLLGLALACGASADDHRKVYRAFHPHWWDQAPYTCWKDDGWSQCWAGAWEVRGLRSHAGGQGVSLMGSVFVKGSREGIRIITGTRRKPKSVSVRCGGVAMSMSPRGQDTRSKVVTYRYDAEPTSGSLADCLTKPITVTIDAKQYRLDSSRLLRALEKARDRL